MLSAEWSDGVRLGPVGSDGVISHTALTTLTRSPGRHHTDHVDEKNDCNV